MKPRVLCLDDEAPMRELLSDFLRGKGCDVATAATGQRAFELAGGKRFDLALFDIRIAGENGLELLTVFRTSFPNLPIIMFTGLDEKIELVEEAKLRGASGFMRKTDPLEDLFDAMRAYLPPL